jgi:hypothetical protein
VQPCASGKLFYELSFTITGGITTHSTGARIALLPCARLVSIGGSSRPVNSGVRFLLNGQDQNRESIILNPERHRSGCVLMNLECYEPARASRVDSFVR